MEMNTHFLSRQTNRQNSLLIWAFVLIMLMSIPPFYFWSISGIVSNVYIIVYFFYGLWERPQNQFHVISLFLFFVFYFYVSINMYEEYNLIGTIFSGIRVLLPLTLFFISESNWTVIFKRFVTIYSLILLPSLVVYFCVVWIGIDLPHKLIPPLNEVKDYGYYAYPFLVTHESFDNFRFCGFFDEPGVIGNISGVLLIVNRCNMRNWKNWILLISGLFSFSLYFYGIVSLYILFFGSKKVKIALIILIVVAMTYLVSSDNVFSDMILSRLEMGDDGELVGDNRTVESFDFFYKKFLGSDMLWFGYGHRYSTLVVDTGGQSYKHLIVDYGIIMFVVYLLAFLYYYISYHVNKKHLLFLLMILASVLFQRPFIFSLSYLFLLISPAAMVKESIENSTNVKYM